MAGQRFRLGHRRWHPRDAQGGRDVGAMPRL